VLLKKLLEKIMTIHGDKFRALDAPFSESFEAQPKKPFLSAIYRLSQSVPGLEAEFDKLGHVRHLTGTESLFVQPFDGNPEHQARSFLAQFDIQQALSLANVVLDSALCEEMSFGWRVTFPQVVNLRNGTKVPVRGGFVHVAMDKQGKIFNLTSTLKFGRKPGRVAKLLGAQAAITAAKAKFAELAVEMLEVAPTEAKSLKGALETCGAEAKLVASEHKGKFDLVYEVTLSVCEPRFLMLFLVKAKSGQVVFHQSMLHYSVGEKKAVAVPPQAKCFLKIPSFKGDISKQVHDHVTEDLPDPKVLKNQRLEMLVLEKRKWVNVKAQADGSFNFSPKGPDESKFSAVVMFVALNTQLALYESWGMKKQRKPIPVYIDDPDVPDNAYFDPENYEIHMGVGSGAPFGLSKHISFDMGVGWHENGHHAVMLQSPGKDLPGLEGQTLHESTGDVLGQLVLEYWFKVAFAGKIGAAFTSADIKKDSRIIGPYAMPPSGIRSVRNKKTVKDKVGEVHTDGEISGAAKADILEAFASTADAMSSSDKLKEAIASFGKLYLLALALVPAHKVTFRDMRRAFLTADQQLFAGANRAVIEKNFDARGITAAPPATVPKTTGRPRKKAA
jgi:Zn-dependent metalloprotease